MLPTIEAMPCRSSFNSTSEAGWTSAAVVWCLLCYQSLERSVLEHLDSEQRYSFHAAKTSPFSGAVVSLLDGACEIVDPCKPVVFSLRWSQRGSAGRGKVLAACNSFDNHVFP